MTKYKLELTETQLRIINDALEEYFRIPLNQWGDLADRLAFKGFRLRTAKTKVNRLIGALTSETQR